MEATAGHLSRWLPFALGLALVATELARGTEPSPPSAAGNVDLRRSRVFTYVGKRGLGHEHAVAGVLRSGHLEWEVPRPTGKLEFDLRTFTADTPEARKALGLTGETDEGTRRQVEENMLGPAVLNVAKYPVATFELTAVRPGATPRSASDGESWEFAGDFTLHGVTRRIQVPVQIRELDGRRHLRGRFSIKQTDYGIKPFSKAFGAVGVTDELIIWGDLWLPLGTAQR